MAVVSPVEQGIAIQVRKKLGHAWGYGEKIYAQVRYGANLILYGLGQYGERMYAETEYGDAVERHGIYQVRTQYGKQVNVISDFYIPTNPQTESQQANRLKLTNAVIAWQNLTTEQKSVYNERAKGNSLSGYNLYIGEYILSN